MRLLLFLLKCVVGILATLGLLVVAVALVLGLAWRNVESWKSAEVGQPDNAVLVLDLAKGLTDGPPGPAATFGGLTGETNLRRLVLGLEAAADDPRVGGLLLRLGAGELSMARAQQLRRAVLAFRKSGKPVQAFAASFGEGGDGTLHYYLAAAADRITLQPSGNLDLVGFTLDQPYARALLDEWDVKARIYRREEYKGAAEPLTFEEMTQPVRENLQGLLDSWLGQLTADVARDRGLTQAAVRGLVDGGPYLPAEALKDRLVDALGYRDEAEAAILKAAGSGAELEPVRDYLSARGDGGSEDGLPRIAVIYGQGPVTLGESGDGSPFGGLSMGADTVSEAFREAAADPTVRAILFRVDSPGGSYAASDTIWRAVRQAKEAGKPVVVSMGALAASGGYFVSAAADRIIAEPGTITGSIGVVSGKILTAGLWHDLGVNWSGVQAGANAGFWDSTRDFTPQQWARFTGFVDAAYADFVGKVASGRKLSVAEAEAVAGGRVWSGADAAQHGLVDGLGGYRAAIDAARELAGLPRDSEVALVDYPKAGNRLERLLRRFLSDSLLATRVAGLLRASGLLPPLTQAAGEAQLLSQDPRANLLRAVR
ncbi:signal peptide peptidase A. Serine peptidase. MEROPS family S49 [Tistlia consotensis]|uniref:Signal peptide peptidase A. Serine peptidase. MEROPS family S49 n=1 Tax=Tistlia consotensis USBA 355 TaxID=560819 RepID=A0A1Y6CMW3_9PROT|nr:signal peptide peptidase SppA [Tistlia consotensis]SMF60748.1 signal peptide peptidase A. Serine peptidase. MEROPS family S49 [Tistlia consotensis USBA 355]SNR92849.1 signal peptide peptidase A. Serine peptidase. MEROPS family S49 [Tistlia consotensis]